MTTTSQKLNRRCKHLVAALALPAIVAMFGTASAFAGAVFTSDANCQKVNGNIYDTKQDVTLNGGPDGTGSALQADTLYCVRVSAPGGNPDLNTKECQVTTDSSGHIACFNLFECTGFLDTDNPGGEYTVEVCPAKNNGSCDFRTSTQCKSDNFKVRASVTGCPGSPPPPVCISCPEPITIPCDSLNGTCVVVNYGDPIVLPATASVVCDPPSGHCFDAGTTTTVTCTATSGTDTAQCTFDVTVGACPQCQLTCPIVTPVCNERGTCGAHVSWLIPSCPDAPGATVVCDHQPGDFYPIGTTTVTCTASEGGGSSQCQFGITVNNCPVTPGGHTIGFWSNKNGLALLNQTDFATLTSCCLVNANGSARDFTGNLSQNKTALNTWLLNANSVNAAYMLSAQLAALKLNVAHGFTTDTTVIVDGTRTVADEIIYANSLLCADGYTPSGDPNRAEEVRVQEILNAINNGQGFIQPGCE